MASKKAVVAATSSSNVTATLTVAVADTYAAMLRTSAEFAAMSAGRAVQSAYRAFSVSDEQGSFDAYAALKGYETPTGEVVPGLKVVSYWREQTPGTQWVAFESQRCCFETCGGHGIFAIISGSTALAIPYEPIQFLCQQHKSALFGSSGRIGVALRTAFRFDPYTTERLATIRQMKLGVPAEPSATFGFSELMSYQTLRFVTPAEIRAERIVLDPVAFMEGRLQ